MDRRQFTAGLVAASVPASAVQAAALNEVDAASGVRVALERGAAAAVALLGRNDGFLANPLVRIPLPGFLKDASKLLKATGQGKKVDELVVAMNRAAEAAVPEAKALLTSTVKALSVEDAVGIVRGGSTSVTDFFATKTRAPLADKFLPIVTRATEKVALAERYNAIVSKASGMGLVKEGQASVQQHVTKHALDGLFLMIGEEEKKIRADPIKTGSAILKKVFGK